MVGKEVSFASTHSISSSADNTRDIGTAEINGLDITIEILKNGWAKLKEFKREPTEEDLKKREAEAEAKNGGKGVWDPSGPQVRAEFLPGGDFTWSPSALGFPCELAASIQRFHAELWGFHRPGRWNTTCRRILRRLWPLGRGNRLMVHRLDKLPMRELIFVDDTQRSSSTLGMARLCV